MRLERPCVANENLNHCHSNVRESVCMYTWVGDSGSTILSHCSKSNCNKVHCVVCCSGSQVVPKNKQTNAANILSLPYMCCVSQ